MMAWEVDKDGDAVVSLIVPHASGALSSQSAYRFIPWHSIGGESTDVPFSAGLDDDDDAAANATAPLPRHRPTNEATPRGADFRF